MASLKEYIEDKKDELKAREEEIKKQCDDLTAKVQEWLFGIDDRDFDVDLRGEKLNLDGFYDVEVTIPTVLFFQKAVLFMPERRTQRNKQNLVGGILFYMLSNDITVTAIYKTPSYREGTVWAYEGQTLGSLYDLNQRSLEELLQKSFEK